VLVPNESSCFNVGHIDSRLPLCWRPQMVSGLGIGGTKLGRQYLAGFQPFHALALAVMLSTVVTRVA
jgi:hypothetical protein